MGCTSGGVGVMSGWQPDGGGAGALSVTAKAPAQVRVLVVVTCFMLCVICTTEVAKAQRPFLLSDAGQACAMLFGVQGAPATQMLAAQQPLMSPSWDQAWQTSCMSAGVACVTVPTASWACS